MVPFVGGQNRYQRMESIMNDQAPSPALPPVVDRRTWQEAREALFAREKAHTREGDAIAAARRRLPMVEVDATIEVIGPDGPVTILDVFEGRKQLIAYFHAWWPGQPAAEQCEGCTFFNSQVRELSYIHSRDATYAVLCKGPYEESIRYRDFLGLDMPWYSVEKTAAQLLEGRDWQRHHLVCYVRDGEPSTAMTRYACSLSYWHRHPDWGFALPAPPAHAPSCAGPRGDG